MVQAKDDDGELRWEVKTDADGNELQVQDRNEDGSLKFYDDGTPVMVPDYVLDANGNRVPVMVPGSHPGNYLVATTFHFEYFGDHIAIGSDPKAFEYYVDFYGRPTRSATMSLTGTWSTDYATNSWNGYWPGNYYTYGTTTSNWKSWPGSPQNQANLNNVDGVDLAFGSQWDANRCTVHGSTAWMKATTAEPEVYSYFNWTGGVTNEKHLQIRDFSISGNYNYDTVPYRWGQADNEQAWYEYVLENRSNSEAEEGFLDMTVNGVSTYNSADPLMIKDAIRGFKTSSLEIDGWKYVYVDARGEYLSDVPDALVPTATTSSKISVVPNVIDGMTAEEAKAALVAAGLGAGGDLRQCE